ncbi:uncharacterized protein NPIL_287631 [Nephila pilipes]|uniref:Uncharacterized protein n=1 Tax=Nephila pilipes TaxID=299642 RepID=A0A8X6NNG0_NEPPI|nr:uncharacterized protein NPIL_287631 [Nephila pilipes]
MLYRSILELSGINSKDNFNVSESAYACVIYVVQRNDNRVTKVTILAAKNKVGPLKPVSIPRLELNGALLLAGLFSVLINTLKDRYKFLCLDRSPSCPFLVVFTSSQLEAVHRQQDFRDLGPHPSEPMAVRNDQGESC